MKKLIFLSIVICGLAGGVAVYLLANRQDPLFGSYCAFCDEKVLDRQTFYEDDLVLALYTHKPVVPGHCLIIPKRHVERFEMLTDEEILRMGQVIKKVNQAVMQVFHTASYLLLQKNGQEVGQTVPHVHFHYVPRKAGDNSTLKFLVQMYIANVRKPIAAIEMQKIIEELTQAIDDNLLPSTVE